MGSVRFEFVIPGEPVPKGSRTIGTRKDGTRYTREASKRVKPWMTQAASHIWAQAQRQGPRIEGAVEVSALFLCKRPAKPSHPYPTRGDVDKMLRAGLDAISAAGNVWLDDRHVVRIRDVDKAFTDGEPRTFLWVKPYSGTRPEAAAA